MSAHYIKFWGICNQNFNSRHIDLTRILRYLTADRLTADCRINGLTSIRRWRWVVCRRRSLLKPHVPLIQAKKI